MRNHHVPACGAALFLICCSAPAPKLVEPPGEPISYSFEKFAAGSVPESLALGGSAGAASGRWSIAETSEAPSGTRVLAQFDATPGAGRRALAWIRDARFGDLTLRVRARSREGSAAVAFGAAWHVRDGANFVVLRVSSEDGRLALESVENGVARIVASRAFTAEPRRWYGIAVEQEGRRVRCGVDGVVLLDVPDLGAVDPGSVGVCTLGGCAAEFDDLSVVGVR